MKYYVCPKTAGQTVGTVICERQGIPTNMEGVVVVDLPKNDGGFWVKSRSKNYPVAAVARAIAAGQINIDDLEEEK